MKRAHVSPLLLALTATISLSCGVGITLIAEDLVGIPFNSVDLDKVSVPEEIIDGLLEDILEYLKEHPDAISEELIEKIKQEIEERIKNGDLSEEDLLDLWEKYGDLIGPYLSEYMEQLLSNIKDPTEGSEPSYNHGGATSGIDNGTLDPEANQTVVFTVDSSYTGQIYIRNTSYGDYLYGQGSFAEAPAFDGSTYITSPLLYAGFVLEKNDAETLKFHLKENYEDVGMLVGDYCGTSYTTSSGESKRFSRSTEARLRRIEDKEYTVSFYPNADFNPTEYSLPSYLSSEEEGYYAFTRANYRSVPDQMKDTISTFLAENKISTGSTPREVEQFFKSNYSYEAQAFSPTPGEDIVVSFLKSEQKAGTCTNFASAMTLICRSLGYSARMVGGYALRAERGENSVKECDAHAWVEVYSSGHGWVKYDPTPGAQSKEEAVKTGGSNGKTGDLAYAPSEEKKLFTYSTSYQGEVYFRSASFLDYDPATSSFMPDAISSDEGSLLYASSSLDKGYDRRYLIQMHMGTRRDTGMIFASYPTSSYYIGEAENESLYDKSLRPANDGRFWREDYSDYTYSFYPDATSASSSLPLDDSSYCANYLPSYLNLPEGYETELASWCSLNNVYSLSGLISFYSEECELDNTETGYKGDAILDFLTTSHKGNSSVFAGAYTLLARYFGTPTRFVAGYKVESDGTEDQEVDESNAYYWVETYQSGFGWVRNDPISKMVCRPSEQINITLSPKGETFVYYGVSHKPSIEDNIIVACNDSELIASGIIDPETNLFKGDKIASASFANMESTNCVRFNTIPFKDVKIEDAKGRDVTSRYNITYDWSKEAPFEITKREIVVTTNNAEIETAASTYTLTKEKLDEVFTPKIISRCSNGLDEENDLAEGDSIEFTYPKETFGSYDVPSSHVLKPTAKIIHTVTSIDETTGEERVIEERDVTDQYSFVYVYSGSLNFTTIKKDITLTTNDMEISCDADTYTLKQSDLDAYTGRILASASSIGESALNEGDVIEYTYPEGTLKSYAVPNSLTLRPTAKIYHVDEDGNKSDVTEQYHIEYAYTGSLILNRRSGGGGS